MAENLHSMPAGADAPPPVSGETVVLDCTDLIDVSGDAIEALDASVEVCDSAVPTPDNPRVPAAREPTAAFDPRQIDGRSIRERYGTYRQSACSWSSHDRWDFASTLMVKRVRPLQRASIHAACRTIR